MSPLPIQHQLGPWSEVPFTGKGKLFFFFIIDSINIKKWKWHADWWSQFPGQLWRSLWSSSTWPCRILQGWPASHAWPTSPSWPTSSGWPTYPSWPISPSHPTNPSWPTTQSWPTSPSWPTYPSWPKSSSWPTYPGCLTTVVPFSIGIEPFRFDPPTTITALTTGVRSQNLKIYLIIVFMKNYNKSSLWTLDCWNTIRIHIYWRGCWRPCCIAMKRT